jgi:RNA exonuclease 1
MLIYFRYSGITKEMLDPVTTTLADIQKELLKLLHPRTVLIGHSLNSDLTALKLTHPFIIDTALIYPHPRGPPLKSSLKWLAQRYLNREIQKGHGTTGPGAGHDSIEDARACLDLVKQKCEKGKTWGTSDAQGENIFKRVSRTGITYKCQGGSAIPNPWNGKSSAAVDWGDPKKGAGAAATFPIGCKSDEEVMHGIIRAVLGDPDGKEIPGGGVDFTFGRLRELEALKGWWNNNRLIAAEQAAKDEKIHPAAKAADREITEATNKDATELVTTDMPDPAPPATRQGDSATIHREAASLPLPTLGSLNSKIPISAATAELSRRLAQIHSALPPCTAFIIYSGSGDPREMSRLQAMKAQFRKEYKIKKWDQLSVKWTDVEEQALQRAVGQARNGIAFIGVK